MKTAFYIFCFLVALLTTACSSTYRGSQKQANRFTHSQQKLIMEKGGNQAMRVFKINQPSDSILLRKKSESVLPNTEDIVLNRFIDRLYSTVTDSMSLGVGIAAPQVGILKQIIWVQRFDKDGFPFEVYLNPKIVQYSKKKQRVREGCLSIPDRSDEMDCRSYAILIEYDTRRGEHITEMVEDFTAVIFQHEIDHLHGILYIDHLEKELSDAQSQ